jgi:RNA polymerase I-specific transcription initiation factor RRN3
VNQFATIAHKTNFLYCYAILDTNRRIASREQPPIPSAPLRSVSETSLTRPRLPSVLSNPSLTAAQPVPRQLLVAEEMDSFFPFDPFKLPLSSVYIDDIYREWTADDESASEEASSDSDADDDSSSASEADTETEEGDFAPRSGGLAVPGSMASREEEDDVARSFEAMSLSPDRQAFGGRLSSSYGRMPSIHI